MVKFWNYSKTSSRGVEEFEVKITRDYKPKVLKLFVDDTLVYKGFLRQAPEQKEGKPPMDFTQTLLLTNDEKILERERENITFWSGEEQRVSFFNNRLQIVAGANCVARNSQVNWDPNKRPKTGVNNKS